MACSWRVFDVSARTAKRRDMTPASHARKASTLNGFGPHLHNVVVGCVALSLAFCVTLSFAFVDVAHSAFPAQNGLIAFQSFRDNSFRSDIHVINPDGTGQLNLTNFPNAQEDTPAWSADGTKLAFTSNRTGNTDIF